nr:hypothetical protein XACG102_1760004 [Xanthomonas citri pv. citri]
MRHLVQGDAHAFCTMDGPELQARGIARPRGQGRSHPAGVLRHLPRDATQAHEAAWSAPLHNLAAEIIRQRRKSVEGLGTLGWHCAWGEDSLAPRSL